MTIITAIIILIHYLNYNAILGSLTDLQNHKNIFFTFSKWKLGFLTLLHYFLNSTEPCHSLWKRGLSLDTNGWPPAWTYHRSHKPGSRLSSEVQQTLPYSSPVRCSHISERNDWSLWSLQEAADFKKPDFKHFPQSLLSRHQNIEITTRNNTELPKCEADNFPVKSTTVVVFINKR